MHALDSPHAVEALVRMDPTSHAYASKRVMIACSTTAGHSSWPTHSPRFVAVPIAIRAAMLDAALVAQFPLHDARVEVNSLGKLRDVFIRDRHGVAQHEPVH